MCNVSFLCAPCARVFAGLQIKEEGQTCDGVAQKERGECRMDILDSVMANLGYQASESYGISWKVA